MTSFSPPALPPDPLTFQNSAASDYLDPVAETKASHPTKKYMEMSDLGGGAQEYTDMSAGVWGVAPGEEQYAEIPAASVPRHSVTGAAPIPESM